MCKMITCKFTLEHERAAFGDALDSGSVGPPSTKGGCVSNSTPQLGMYL